MPLKTINILDSWVKANKINKIDFIWADVQGAERELILGGLKTLNEKTEDPEGNMRNFSWDTTTRFI